jgi:hypothetical protein
MSPMKTYAMIDIYSGFFWGCGVADNPAAACQEMDENLGDAHETYTETGRYEAAADYDVYDASAIAARLTDADGQDEKVIALVQAQPFVARLARS